MANLEFENMPIHPEELTIERICKALGNKKVPAQIDGNTHVTRVACTTRMVVEGCVYCVIAPYSKHDETVRLAFRQGAICAVTLRKVCDEDGNELPCIVCSSPKRAAVKLASLIKLTSNAKTVAITGSVGKTSTKEMVRLVCAKKYKTVYSKTNENGLGQVVRYAQSLHDGTEVYIQEAGISKPESLELAGEVMHPDYFVVTNIGFNHIGYFGGKQENILHEKLALDRRAKENAVGFVNWDDPLLRKAEYVHPIVSYAVDDHEADFYVDNIVERNAQLFFDIVEKATGARTAANIRVPGKHNLLNAACAFAIGRQMEIPVKDIVDALAEFKTTGVRQNLVQLAGMKVFLDCYNASEEAIYSVVKTLDTIDTDFNGRKILVLADIDDKLGDRTEEIHRRVGKTIPALGQFDVLACFGNHAAWYAAEAIGHVPEVMATEDRETLEFYLRKIMRPGDVIAVKGGQQMQLPRTVDNLFGTALFLLDTDVSRLVSKTVEHGCYRYARLSGYGTVLEKYNPDAGEKSDLLASVEGEPLRVIGKSAFSSSHIRTLTIPEGVTAIEFSACYNCENLRLVNLPSTLRYIGPSAFNTCRNLTTIEVPEGTTTIDNRAFAYCASLHDITIPASVMSIADDAFTGSPNVVFHVQANSYASIHLQRKYPRSKIKIIGE